jgi:hypothetical protein
MRRRWREFGDGISVTAEALALPIAYSGVLLPFRYGCLVGIERTPQLGRRLSPVEAEGKTGVGYSLERRSR